MPQPFSSQPSRPPIVALAVVVIAILAALWLPSSLFEHLDAQDIMVIQSPISGDLTIHTDPGVKWQGFGKVTKYPKRSQYWFSAAGDQGAQPDQSIRMRFNDGYHGQLSGGISWEMPTDRVTLLKLHAKYGAFKPIEQALIRTVVEKSVYLTGSLMSSKESSASRRNDLLRYIEDQVQNGVYETETEQAKEKDPLTGQDRTVSVVRLVRTDKGVLARQEASPLQEYGIRTQNLTINGLKYDDAVEQQIQQQASATMQVQLAIANALKAEQDKKTTEANGQASAAAAKWKQEALKATAVTEAEQALAVATLARQTAEQEKQAAILKGEGEATARKLVMQADNALEARLKAEVEINSNYAMALKEIKVPLVPSVVMGGDGKSGSDGVAGLIAMLRAQSALAIAKAAQQPHQ